MRNANVIASQRRHSDDIVQLLKVPTRLFFLVVAVARTAITPVFIAVPTVIMVIDLFYSVSLGEQVIMVIDLFYC